MSFLTRIGSGSTHAGLSVLATLLMQALPPSIAPYAGAIGAAFAALSILIPDPGTSANPATAVTTGAVVGAGGVTK